MKFNLLLNVVGGVGGGLIKDAIAIEIDQLYKFQSMSCWVFFFFFFFFNILSIVCINIIIHT